MPESFFLKKKNCTIHEKINLCYLQEMILTNHIVVIMIVKIIKNQSKTYIFLMEICGKLIIK